MNEKGMETEIHFVSGETIEVAESPSSVEGLVNTATTRVISFEGPDTVVHWVNVEHIEYFHAA